jgi:hypothetical protein
MDAPDLRSVFFGFGTEEDVAAIHSASMCGK